MKILVTNHHLYRQGGSETACYALAVELLRQGHEAHIYAREEGSVYNRALEAGVLPHDGGHYDLCIASHTTTQEDARGWCDRMVRVCHGTTPKLEQPAPGADAYAAVSVEVQVYMKKKGFGSEVVPNAVDTGRFRATRPVTRAKPRVLSLCQTEEAEDLVRRACDEAGLVLTCLNKFRANVWHVEEIINRNDLVVGIGRGAVEAMACSRPVVLFDHRPYMGNSGWGYVFPGEESERALVNFSGRDGHPFAVADLVREIGHYDPAHGDQLRGWVLTEADVADQARKYLSM